MRIFGEPMRTLPSRRAGPAAYHRHMQLIESLASTFFRVFGITQPSEQMRRRAAWFLLGMLTLMAVAVSAGGVLLYHLMRN